jgi:acyl dehydratase
VPIAYPEVLQLAAEEEELAWSDQRSMLYALSIGFGSDPLDARELPFVYENGLKAVPTLATVLTLPMALLARTGVNFARVVHGEQGLVLHKPLPPEGKARAVTRVAAAYDKGADKGAVLILESQLTEPSGEALATLRTSIFARGDGGFGGPPGEDETPPPPDRPADLELDFPTRPDQALLYRLNGDRNPLHADPAFAKMLGFPRPILHGLCTYGITCRAVLQAYADFDPARIASHQARFSAPLFPGETVTVQLWREGSEVAFQARVKDRDAVVIRNGRSELR